MPFPHAQGYGTGAAPASPVSVSGIRSVDTLLAVFSWDPAGPHAPTAHDATSFVVSDGAIESATDDTTGRRVAAMWATG